MLKRIFAIILCVISVFCIISCGNMENTSTTKDPLFINNGGTVSHNSPNGEGHGYAASYDYLSFEENLEAVDTIVKANLISISNFGNEYVKFTFKVNETLLGEAEDTVNIYASVMQGALGSPHGYPIYFSEDAVTVMEDCEYLLLIIKSEDVYSELSPRYGWQRGMIINLDDIPASEMYNEPLALHATGIDINTCTEEELIDYVCELTKGNKPKYLISKADTLEEIVDDAEKVFHIEIKSLLGVVSSDLKTTEIWSCEIKATLKGSLSNTIKEVSIIFFPDTVEAGEEYIVAVDGIDSDTFYEFITKDSLRPLSEKAEIKGYID